MTLTDDEKHRIAARARRLREYLDASTTAEATDSDGDDAGWLTEWRDCVADGDEATFRTRLEFEDCSLEAHRKRLRATDWPEAEPLPEWVADVENLLEYVETRYADDVPRDPVGGDDVPFSDVFTPFVKYASERVDWGPTSQDTIDCFEEQLVQRLQRRFFHPLFIEFKTYLAKHDEDLALAENPEVPDRPRRYYDAFVSHLLSDELESFFVEYAVLARLLVSTIDHWVEATEEFCTRFEADRPALVDAFGSSDDLGIITDVAELGDAHHGGKTVLGLTFASGVRVAYKPRSLEIDAAFHEFLSWVNDRSSLPEFRTLTCLVRDGYGWQEWIEPDGCQSEDGVARYYRRAGALVAVLYALNFTDGHLENLIASGDQPMVVDLETLLVPKLPLEKQVNTSPFVQIAHQSVLRTRVVPMHFSGADVQNVGGLGTAKGEASGVEIPEFENVNTDVMDLDYRTTTTIGGESLPHLDGERIQPEEYDEVIEDGFERAYRFLLANRTELLDPDGVMAAFEGAESRYLYRPTNTYGKTLVPLTTPSYLRSGLQFSCRIETLARPFAEGNVDEAMWEVFEAERTALWRFDVPRFTTKTTSTEMFHGDRAIADAFEATPMEQVYRRIESLSEDDLREQRSYLRLAYNSERLSHPEPPAPVDADPNPSETNSELATRTAHDVFDRIQAESRRNGDDDPTWDLREHRQGGVSFRPLEDGLYEGRIGISLFGAALARAFDEDRYRAFVADVTAPLLDELDEDAPFEDARIGGGHGLGSVVYGFTKLGELLGTDEYVRAARDTASLLTDDDIEADEDYDVLNGSAGSVLGLLALHEHAGDDAPLETAVTAGEHLLANRVEVNGVRTWDTIDHRPLNGPSHGVTGIAYALYRLGEVTGERRFVEAAREGLEYEREQYSPARNNWPDLRTSTDADFATGWCSGRAGIGLTRLALFELTGEESFRREAENALAGIDPDALLGRDHLCCGNVGRVEFLSRAGRTFDDPTYSERAWEIARSMVRRAERGGQFTVPWQTEDWYNPVLFIGEAGVGYSLLRLLDSELPCVLLWE